MYERGISLFKYPHVKDIWTAYLTQFVERYAGRKLERARDLFRQAIDEAPAEEAKPLFLQSATYEEQHGLARNAMQVGGWGWKCRAEGGGGVGGWWGLCCSWRAAWPGTQHAADAGGCLKWVGR